MLDVRNVVADRAAHDAVMVAAIGYEERTNHLFSRLAASGVGLRSLELLDLETFAIPLREDASRRWDSRVQFELVADEHNIPFRVHQTDPYAWFETVRLFTGFLDRHTRLYFDISGLTRLQIAALASSLYLEQLRSSTTDRVRSVGYTRPLSYRHRPRSLRPPISYEDCLIAPLKPATILRRSGFSRGVFLLGHEGQRAHAAYRAHPSAAGVALLPHTQGQDDWLDQCEYANKDLLRSLRSSRMPDANEADLARMRDGWLEAIVPADGGYGNYLSHIAAQAEAAREDRGAPLLLYLLGPKVACLFACVAALEVDSSAWVVYSVPSHYDVGAVDGVMTSVSFQIAGELIGLRDVQAHGVSVR